MAWSVGPVGAERENANGTKLRRFAYRCGLVVANTWFRTRDGDATFKGGVNASTRVDYLLVDADTWRQCRRGGVSVDMKIEMEVGRGRGRSGGARACPWAISPSGPLSSLPR